MSTLIIYESKHGTTKKCTEILADKIKEDVDKVNLKKNKDINLNEYESVLIGASVYMGKIQSEIREFCKQNEKELTVKNLGIFLSSALAKEEEFKENFSEKILSSSKAVENFGYEFNKDDFNLFEKFILKMVNNQEKDYGIKEKRIDKFLEQMELN